MQQVMKIKMSLPFSQSGYFLSRDIIYATLMKLWNASISDFVHFRCLPGYPFKCPKLQVEPEKGLMQVDVDKLLSLLLDQVWSAFALLFFLVLMDKKYFSYLEKKPGQNLVSHNFIYFFNRPIQILEKVELWYLILWKLHRSSFLKFFLHRKQLIVYSHWLLCLLFPHYPQRSIHLQLIIFFYRNKFVEIFFIFKRSFRYNLITHFACLCF